MQKSLFIFLLRKTLDTNSSGVFKNFVHIDHAVPVPLSTAEKQWTEEPVADKEAHAEVTVGSRKPGIDYYSQILPSGQQAVATAVVTLNCSQAKL